jgi:hypothetical protein
VDLAVASHQEGGELPGRPAIRGTWKGQLDYARRRWQGGSTTFYLAADQNFSSAQVRTFVSTVGPRIEQVIVAETGGGMARFASSARWATVANAVPVHSSGVLVGGNVLAWAALRRVRPLWAKAILD